jgi:hypothetical protein
MSMRIAHGMAGMRVSSFSFLDDDVSFWDVRAKQKAPTVATLNRVGAAIYEKLADIRRRWWEVKATVCLDNAFVHLSGKSVVLRDTRFRDAVQVVRARYDPSRSELFLELADGTSHVQNL